MRNVNSFLRFITTALAVCLMMTMSAAAELDDFTFAVNSSGNGYVVTDYKGTDAKVVVPDWYDGKPVTEIGSSAFEGVTTMTSVSLPSTIVAIGRAAFKGCSNLSTLTAYTAAAQPPTPARLPGDVDLSGVVDANDALLILKSESGWSVAMDRVNADVDGNGTVDIKDATLILQYAAGQDVTLK